MDLLNYGVLPRWPLKGYRRRLDILWLESVEMNGIHSYSTEFPSMPPAQLSKAVSEFNTNQFWQCHETLEALWKVTPYPLRHFYQGIIKLASAFHHVGRHNLKGSRNKLNEGIRLLRVFCPHLFGLDVQAICDESLIWQGLFSKSESIEWKDMDDKPRPQIKAFPKSL